MKFLFKDKNQCCNSENCYWNSFFNYLNLKNVFKYEN